jgi:hypothetical protein
MRPIEKTPWQHLELGVVLWWGWVGKVVRNVRAVKEVEYRRRGGCGGEGGIWVEDCVIGLGASTDPVTARLFCACDIGADADSDSDCRGARTKRQGRGREPQLVGQVARVLQWYSSSLLRSVELVRLPCPVSIVNSHLIRLTEGNKKNTETTWTLPSR